jgi:spore germination protein
MIILTIYTVKAGDSLYAIARRYGVTVDALIYANQIANPLRLVVGQAIIIPVARTTHRVARGQSLYSIARMYGTSVDRILAVNPTITDRDRLNVGQVIIIPRGNELGRSVAANGFSLNVSDATLSETLPNLTYFSKFSWQVDAGGGITPINDIEENAAARAFRVAPMMTITNISPSGGFSGEITHAVLTNQEAQNDLITNINAAMRQRNYYGLIIDFEYIFPNDRESYNQFLRRITASLHAQGKIVATAIAPKVSATQAGTLYEAHDYPAHGEIVDYVIIMTYEWGYTYGPAMAVAPIDQVRRVLNYAVTAIPARKIMMGMPNYGYNWTLPFVQGTAARTVTNTGAVTLASNVGAVIKYDQKQQAPFFNYYDAEGRRHEVWFDDARSIQARLKLIDEYGLAGVSYWTIDNLFRAQYIILRSLYDVNKVL